MCTSESTELWQKCLASCNLSQNDENKQNRSQLNSREGFIYFVSSWMAMTHNILSQLVSPDKKHLQSIIHPGSWRGQRFVRGLVLGIASCLLSTSSLIYFFFPKFAKFHVGTWKVDLWTGNCPIYQIKTMLYKICHATLKRVKAKTLHLHRLKAVTSLRGKFIGLAKKTRDRNFKTQKKLVLTFL